MEKLELEVLSNESKIKELTEKLDSQLPFTEKMMADKIRSIMIEIVTEIVKEQSDNTNSLGLEKLKEMKNRLNALIEEVSQNVSEFMKGYESDFLLNRDRELRKQPSDYDSTYGSKTKYLYGYTIKTELEEFIKKEIGYVGALLSEFNYKVSNGSNYEYKDEFEKKYKKDGAEFIYKNKNRRISSKDIEEFASIFSEISKLKSRNIELEEKINQENAKNLWDSI